MDKRELIKKLTNMINVYKKDYLINNLLIDDIYSSDIPIGKVNTSEFAKERDEISMLSNNMYKGLIKKINNIELLIDTIEESDSDLNNLACYAFGCQLASSNKNKVYYNYLYELLNSTDLIRHTE